MSAPIPPRSSGELKKSQHSGLVCPICGTDTEVTSTRRQDARVLRYRRCKSVECRTHFATAERIIGRILDSNYISVKSLLENSLASRSSSSGPASSPDNGSSSTGGAD